MQRQRATVKALGVLQRNLGRRIIASELTYLSHSEVWHEFLYRVIRGQCIALPWGYVEEGPTDAEALEQFIKLGLDPYHAPRPEAPDVPEPAPPDPTEREKRIEAAKASRRRHRGGIFGV